MGLFIGLYVQIIYDNSKMATAPEVTQNPNSNYLTTPKVKCYFTSTWEDVTREEELNCDYYDRYYKTSFETKHP